MAGASRELGAGTALRLRERFAPRRPSSSENIGDAACGEGVGGSTPTMGEYGRGVDEDENDETCRSMMYSCVALVSVTMCVRSGEESGWDELLVLMRLSNWMTVCITQNLDQHDAKGVSA